MRTFLKLSLLLLLEFQGVQPQQNSQNSGTDYIPVFIAEIYTSGSKTPLTGNPLGRDFISMRSSNSLTEFGMRQHLNLGVDVRLAYPNLFKDIEDISQVKVYSSGSRASILSAESHNLGLFHKLGEKKILKDFQEYKFSSNHWRLVDFKTHQPVLTTFQKEQFRVPLIAREKKSDLMFHPKIDRSCPKIKKLLEENSSSLLSTKNRATDKIYKELSLFGLDPDYFEEPLEQRRFFNVKKNQQSPKSGFNWDLKKASAWYDVLASDMNWYGIPPLEISEELLQSLEVLHSQYQFGLLDDERIVKTFTNEISFKIIDEFMSHNQQGILENTMKREARGDLDRAFGFESQALKYLGFSVEDRTMMAFMLQLGLVENGCHMKILTKTDSEKIPCKRSPEPASNFRFEMNKVQNQDQRFPSYFLRTYFNGEVIDVCGQTSGYCNLHVFVEIFGSKTIFKTKEENLCLRKKAKVQDSPIRFILVIFLLLAVL